MNETILKLFVEELNKKFPKQFDWSDHFEYTVGKRFYKIVRSNPNGKSRSCYAFVDKENGDLYKAASWNAPANYVRGNITNPSGLEACDEYSVKYLTPGRSSL